MPCKTHRSEALNGFLPVAEADSHGAARTTHGHTRKVPTIQLMDVQHSSHASKLIAKLIDALEA